MDYIVFFPFFTEKDLVYYNTIYRECGYHHHATKHFSLIKYIVGFDELVSKYEFDFEFEKILDLFVFRYKAIYATDRLSPYMYSDVIEKIKTSLIDIEDIDG